jgi:hypothetical protein
MVSVKFVNKSGEEVTLHHQDGSVLNVLESGKRWNRDPKEGTLSTVAVDSCHGQKFPPPRAKPHWIEETEWIGEVPDDSIYAPYRTITFLDGNEVKLKRRPFWKEPDMAWPVVTFLFNSHRMKVHKERLDHYQAADASVFYNGIPCRLTVDPLSKYAPFKNWIFSEVMELKELDPLTKQVIETYEITQHGEGKRPAGELEKIEKLKAEAEERKKLGRF